MNLKIAIEAAFGEHSNNRHQVKNASQNVFQLAYHIAMLGSICKHSHEQSSPFQSKNILQHGVEMLNDGIKRFNQTIVEEKWKAEEDLDNATTTFIAVLDNIVTIDDEPDN